MDTDLSLIEISGEDEDDGSLLLLHQQQQFAPSIESNSLFSCSPLQILRSKTSSHSSPIPIPIPLESKEEAETASCSYYVDSGNRENSNANKSELPKLSLEPQQMKRKKKGGGCNLRQSLAWNRAFFTEEGVLDPVELSMINENFGKSSGELLSGIKENEMELSSGSLDRNRNSSHLQTPRKGRKIKCSLLAERTPRKDRKIEGGSLPKPYLSARANIAPSPSAKRKVFSPNDVNKSGSKRSSCPPPVASLSQKSLASVSATKATMKEPKVSKVPVPKQDPQLLSTIAKTVVRGLSFSKHKPIYEPASVQKSAKLNGFAKNSKAQNNTKAGPDSRPLIAKPLTQQPRRNLATSPLEVPLPTNLKQPLVSEAKNTPKMIRDPVIPTINQASTVCAGESSKSVSFLPHSVNCTGGNKQLEILAVKPSGLRMPSPSLGFFGQSKASASLRTAQPRSLPESSISKMQKPGALNSSHGLRPPRPPGKIHANKNMKLPSLSSGCPVSTTVPASHESIKSNFEDGNIQKVEVKVLSDLDSQKTCAIIAKQQLQKTPCDVDNYSPEHGEAYTTEMLIMENSELQKHENKPVSQSEEQLGTDIKVDDACQRSQDLGGASLENVDTIRLSSVVQVKVPVSEPGYTGVTVGDNNGQSQWQHGLLTSCIAETDGILHGSQRLQMGNGIFSQENGSLEDFQKHNTGNIVDNSWKAIEVDNSGFLIDKNIKQKKDFVLGDKDMDRKQQTGGALVQCLNKNLALERDCSVLTTSAAHNHFVFVDNRDNFEEQTEHSSLHLEVAQSSEGNYGSCLKDHLLKGKNFSSEESEKENSLESVRFASPEESCSYVSELKSSNTLCHAQPSVEDCGFYEAEYSKCQPDEDVQSGHVDSKSEAETEHPCITSQHKAAAEVIGGLAISHVVGHIDAQEHQYSLPVEEHRLISDFHPGEEIVCRNQVSLRVHTGLLRSECDVTEQSAEQPNMKNICYPECDKRYLEESQSAHMCQDLLFLGSSLLEESQIPDNGRDADVSQKVEGFGGNEVQSSFGLSQHKSTYQTNEESAGVNNAMKELLARDGLVQCRDHNLLVGNVHGECGEHPQLQSTSSIDKVSQENQILSLSNPLPLADSIAEESEKHVVETVSQATSECYSSLALEDLSPNGENQQKLDNSVRPIQDKDAAVSVKKSGRDKKQGALTIKPPPYAVPFSDEWLAAFEAAGEEILTMKSGAVQNSPPDKAPAEPGPYSPVKRKRNQSIGPYDCTKYTNVGDSSPQ